METEVIGQQKILGAMPSRIYSVEGYQVERDVKDWHCCPCASQQYSSGLIVWKAPLFFHRSGKEFPPFPVEDSKLASDVTHPSLMKPYVPGAAACLLRPCSSPPAPHLAGVSFNALK